MLACGSLELASEGCMETGLSAVRLRLTAWCLQMATTDCPELSESLLISSKL